jgi:flagellar basal body-associated protein FliL
MNEKKPKEATAVPAKGKEEPAKEPEQKPSGGNNNLVLLIVIIVVGIALQIFIPRIIAPPARQNDDTEDSTGNGPPPSKFTDVNATAMGPTTAETPVEVLVNIAGTDGERFLKAALVMEYIDASDKKKEGDKKEGDKKGGEGVAEAIKQRMPKYKNYLLENLSKMTMAELTAPDTKEKIRKDFIQMVNNSLPPHLGVVKDIYFTQYIIQ